MIHRSLRVRFALAPALVALQLAVASGATVSPAAAQEPATAFVDVTVLPMDSERVLEHQTVVVRDGRIAEIAPVGTVEVPADAQRIDGQGRFLMPGLAEMHAHIPGPQDPRFTEDVLFLYIANGVTFARGMLGHPSHLELRERAARGELLAPTIYTSGPSFNGNSAPTPETAERMVREQRAAGYDFLKIHPGLSRAVYDRLVETAREVGMEFAGHVPTDVGLERALDARQATVDHLDGYMERLLPEGAAAGGAAGFFGLNLAGRVDPARIPAAAAATREACVWNVPTQSLIENLALPEDAADMARRPEMRYMPPATLESWIAAKREFQAAPNFDPVTAQRYVEVRRQLIRALHDAGAGLLLGSDAPQIFNVPGFSIHPELRMMVASGLTPYQVLVSGTRAPAAFLGMEDEFGTVAVGRRADLILLEANPLDDVANVQRRAGVMVRGRWLEESDIELRLEAVAARRSAAAGS